MTCDGGFTQKCQSHSEIFFKDWNGAYFHTKTANHYKVEHELTQWPYLIKD